MEDNAGKLYIGDGNLEPSEKLSGLNIHGHTVYEVIRIINGVPLFFEEHYVRLQSSLDLLGFSLTTPDIELKKQMRRLTDSNGESFCNVKVIVFHESGVQRYVIYVSKSYYPGMEEINKGVRVSLLEWERQNPNIKQVNNEYKQRVSKALRDNNAFEVLLVNNQNKITEGSKSNVFFIKKGKVYTAPGAYVLKGITRQYIIDACKDVGIEVVESLLDVNDLEDIEAIFISGTSIKVLPIGEIDAQKFSSSSHSSVVAIRNRFDEIIKEYTEKNR